MKLLKYQIASYRTVQTESGEEEVLVLTPKDRFSDEKSFERNLALAQAEAYNGDVEVEDLGPDPDPPEDDVASRVTALENAIAEGLNLYEGDLGNG